MSIDILTSFIKNAPTELASAWSHETAVALAASNLPTQILGDHEPLLRGDQHRLWLRWFLEGMVSPQLIALNPALGRLDILQSAMRRINAMYAAIDIDRRTKLAEAITGHLYASVEILRAANKRDHADAATRLALISGSSSPRCYICGYAFSKHAKDAFLRVKGRSPPKLPLLVDVFRPRGLVARDEKIEIEHVVPVASGGFGKANLRLACGWCNKHKSNKVSIYESSLMAPRTFTYHIGGHRLSELPNPFWIIRMLALRGKCQHVDGCARIANDAELFISLIDWAGSPNPTNLTVYCEVHDPIRVDRFQATADVEKLWHEKKR